MRNLLIAFLTILATFASSEEVSVDPDLKKFKFNTLDTIPKAPLPTLENNKTDCWRYYLNQEEQKNPLSNNITKKGWTILSEAQLGQYDLIAFAGKFEVGTSATCYVTESNIAIFYNGSLLGVIYLESKDDALIGYLEQMDDGFIRLFSGDPLQVPVADLNISAEGLKLVAISNKSLSYCGGKTVIPDTLGMTIQDARDKLFKSGFFAIYHEQDPTSWTNKYYPGINELAGCSNGIPWCYFEYVEQNSRLTLLTLGSDEVIRADVLCD